MHTIHKVSLTPQPGIVSVTLPKDAIIIKVDAQADQIAVWYECDTDKPMEIKTFTVMGTGMNFSNIENCIYLGTTQCPPFVWHVYEVMP